jgi:DNA polymerase
MITLDFETRSVADLIKWGATRYALDPSTQALCFAWAYDDEEHVDLWHRDHPWIERSPVPDELLDRISSGEIVEAHNAFFEYVIWNEVLLREYPDDFRGVKISLDQLRCSAAKASCLSLPRGLGDAVAALGLEQKKLADGRRLINKLSKPVARRRSAARLASHDRGPEFCEEEIEHRKNWEYCKQDVRSERGLSDFCPDMTERELEYWRMDLRMNQRGILLDRAGAAEALRLAESEAERLNGELAEITGGAVSKGSQRKALLAWTNGRLSELGGEALKDTRADTLSFSLYGVPTKAGDDAKIAAKIITDEKWAALSDDSEAAKVRRVLEVCMEVNKASVAKYKRMEASVCGEEIGGDGRLHDIMLYNGADRTGRWAGKGVQPHNFVRGYSSEMCRGLGRPRHDS